MKKLILPVFFLMLLFTAQSVLGQGNVKITTGVVAYNNQDYSGAIKALSVGLSDLSTVKAKNVPKAYYYRGKSRLMYMRKLAGKAAEGKQLSEGEENTLKTIVIDAYGDFKNARINDDGKWGKKVDAEMKFMGGMILQAGLSLLNTSFDDKLTAEEKKMALTETVKYMDVAQEIQPGNHMVYDLRAQAKLAVKDSSGAYDDFAKAISTFEAKEPARADQLIAYACYRKALLDRYMKNDPDAALADLDKGKKLLDKENKRVMKNSAEMSDAQKNGIQKQYAAAKEALTKFELDLLLNTPGKLDEALAKFEKATVDEPKNYILHVAYAQLLEKTDAAKAEAIYQKATKIDPNKNTAFFNLGAMYVNQGVELYKEANETDDYEKAQGLQKKGDDLYQKAFPYLENALRVDQCDTATLQALLNICINLGASDESYNEKYKEFKAIQKGCKG